MRILVVAETAQDRLRVSSRSALAMAQQVANTSAGEVELLMLGDGLESAAGDAAQFAPVIVAEHPALAHPTADRWAAVLAKVVAERSYDMLVAASNTLAKDAVSRAAGLLGGAMASDVIGHDWADGHLQFRRPMFAGTVIGTVELEGTPLIVTVRSSSYEPAVPTDSSHSITPWTGVEGDLPNFIEFETLEAKETGRPDVTEARVVVSGGRALKTSEDFESIVGKLADALGGATGSSRPLVDSGITPNDLQVGQTGKIVAPDLYIALGISGAVQHLAGMKNSKFIVAINKDADAPIFEVADYGLLGDVYQIVPEMISKLNDQ